jgi:hypothetical protein
MFLRIAVFSLAFPICSVMTAVSIHLSMSVAVLGPKFSYRSLAQIRAKYRKIGPSPVIICPEAFKTGQFSPKQGNRNYLKLKCGCGKSKL